MIINWFHQRSLLPPFLPCSSSSTDSMDVVFYCVRHGKVYHLLIEKYIHYKPLIFSACMTKWKSFLKKVWNLSLIPSSLAKGDDLWWIEKHHGSTPMASADGLINFIKKFNLRFTKNLTIFTMYHMKQQLIFLFL